MAAVPATPQIPDDATVLITGGAGFIGSAYTLLAAHTHPGWTIRVLDALTYCGFMAHLKPLANRIEFIHGDIACPDTAAAATANCHAVINFAAESHVDRSIIDSKPFTHTNVQGVSTLLDACRHNTVNRFLHVSTDEVYGDVSHTADLSNEDDRLNPVSPYATSKAQGDTLTLQTEDLDTVVTRGANTWGPRQYPEKVIPLFITNTIDEQPMPIYGNGTALRDYLHVDDHARGIDHILHHGTRGEAYNLGARASVDTNTIAAMIQQAMDAGTPAFVADRPDHDMRYAVNPAKAEALGWRPTITLAQGLADTISWYRDNHAWWRAIKDGPDFRHFKWD